MRCARTKLELLKTIRSKTGVRQLQKEYRIAHPPQAELCFLLQDWSDPYNVGGMFRVAAACGASLVMSGKTPLPPHPQIHVTSMGMHRTVPWRHEPGNEEAAVALREEGWSLVVVEVAEGAVPYVEYAWPDRVCLVLGNEQTGVYDRVMRHRDGAVFIPMAGKGRSLNVHVAGAVVAFHALYGPRSVAD